MSSNTDFPILSIIIPTLNEAANLPLLLSHLETAVYEPLGTEVIIVDGQSTDNTLAIVARFKSSQLTVKSISSAKGRAVQMNAGAKAASGTLLYFLHADSFPPQNFDALIRAQYQMGNLAGCFSMQFDSNHWWLKLAGWFTRFNWKMCRGGDQSQFITASLFKEIGGFNEDYKIFEDNILIAELYKRKQFVVIPNKITTSCRRYGKCGIWNLQYRFWMIYYKHRRGAGPNELYSYYKKHLAN